MSEKVAVAKVVDRYVFGGTRTEPYRILEHDEAALAVFNPGDAVAVILESEYEMLEAALAPASIKALIEAAQAAERRLSFLHDGHMLVGKDKTATIRNIVELELLEAALAPFKGAQEVRP